MHEETLELLCCPNCHGGLRLKERDNGLRERVGEGQLLCLSCGGCYPIRKGIPVLLGNARGGPSRVSRNFGYKWRAYPEFLRTYERRFLDQIAPLDPTLFLGKTVLEACCGIGIPDFFIARAGAKRVVGFDVSDSVFIASQRCREYPNVDFVRADIGSFPFRPRFDIAVCLAALHHLPIPGEGFKRLVSALRPGGMVILWVYGWEGSGLVRWFVDPIRRVTAAHCPLPLLNGIAALGAVGVWGLAHTVYRLPWRSLPLFEYLRYIRSWPIGQMREMVFDQLLSPMTHYLRREELIQWFKVSQFNRYEVTPLNGMSWKAYGILS